MASVPFSMTSKKHSFALSGSSKVNSTAFVKPMTANEAARAIRNPKFMAAVGYLIALRDSWCCDNFIL